MSPPDRLTPCSHLRCEASTPSSTYLLYVSNTQSTIRSPGSWIGQMRGTMHTPATSTSAPRTLTRVYPGTTSHIRAVRSDVRDLLADCPVADDAILCASELATNAVRHSRSGVSGGTFT